MSSLLQSTRSDPNMTGSLPDVNAETYPFEVVKQCLDRAAFMNLYAVPGSQHSRRINAEVPDDWFHINGGYGLECSSKLRNFDSTLDKSGCLKQRVEEEVGNLRMRLQFGPESVIWQPGREPEPRVFDPWRPQSFVSTELVIAFGSKLHGFRGYIFGRTFPICIDGRPLVVLSAIGCLNEGIGNLIDFGGTICLQGSLNRDLGFLGNVTIRIVDPNEKLVRKTHVHYRVNSADSELDTSSFHGDAATYLCMRIEKEDPSQRTQYGPQQNNGLVTLLTPAVMKDFYSRVVASDNEMIQVENDWGHRIAQLDASVSLDILAPPGTAERPNDFQTRNVYKFLDSRREVIGTITVFLSTGKSFELKFPQAPGQPGMQFGGFGYIEKGTGIFDGVHGTATDNSAIGVAPHAVSGLHVIRIVDPNGRYQGRINGAAHQTTESHISVVTGTNGIDAPISTQKNLLPDINKETYPFETVQELLDRVAHFNIYARPMEKMSGKNSAIYSGKQVVGYSIENDLHRFIVRLDTPTQQTGVRALNEAAELVGRTHQKWILVPEDFRAIPNREAPTTFLNTAVSQRFVMMDTTFQFGNGNDAFHGFGTGRTFPATQHGAQTVLAGAVGTITRGTGRFSGVEGTFTYCGALSPRDGFTGSIFLRVADPTNQFHVSTLRAIKVEKHKPIPMETGVSYLIFRGQKKDRSQKTSYRFRSNGEYLGITLQPQIRLFGSDFTAHPRISCNYTVGDAVGDLDALILFNPLDPGAPGTQYSPIPFHDYDNYVFKDSLGHTLGSFGFDGGAGHFFGHAARFIGEGRVFITSLPDAPGQQAVKFGGFGPIVNGTGIFADAEGLVAHNAAVGISPHVLSTVFIARIIDPNGKYRRS
ncbi:MAG: hypothetical protein ABL921_04565 [Pirellula sp.]